MRKPKNKKPKEYIKVPASWLDDVGLMVKKIHQQKLSAFIKSTNA
jgi:hypothetical protein